MAATMVSYNNTADTKLSGLTDKLAELVEQRGYHMFHVRMEEEEVTLARYEHEGIFRSHGGCCDLGPREILVDSQHGVGASREVKCS